MRSKTISNQYKFKDIIYFYARGHSMLISITFFLYKINLFNI